MLGVNDMRPSERAQVVAGPAVGHARRRHRPDRGTRPQFGAADVRTAHPDADHARRRHRICPPTPVNPGIPESGGQVPAPETPTTVTAPPLPAPRRRPADRCPAARRATAFAAALAAAHRDRAASPTTRTGNELPGTCHDDAAAVARHRHAAAAEPAQRRTVPARLRRGDHHGGTAARRGQPGTGPALGSGAVHGGLSRAVRRCAPGHPALHAVRRSAAAAGRRAAERPWPGDDSPPGPGRRRTVGKRAGRHGQSADAVDARRCHRRSRWW